MLNKIEGLLRELFTCLQSAKMYGTDHILFQKALDKAYLVFQDALSSRDEIVNSPPAADIAWQALIIIFKNTCLIWSLSINGLGNCGARFLFILI